MAPTTLRASVAPSPWLSLRRRAKTLTSEVYAECIGDCVGLVQGAFPPLKPGLPTLRARLANLLITWIACFVSCVGHIERLLQFGRGGLPVNEIREATLAEVVRGVGALTDKRLLPSAYEVWIGQRTEGVLRLRYTYDTERLRNLLSQSSPQYTTDVVDESLAASACLPARLDEETREWVRSHVEQPAPYTRLHVWRALKRRLYHYDAGVVAFRGFPRNFLLSRAQWEGLLERPAGRGGVALDIGAGDGSLNLPMRHLFERVVATELTVPLVCRLRTTGLDAVIAEEPRAEWLRAKTFDAVLILNVLDRCKDPYRMLEQARSLLAPDGTLVVSVVLPASQSDAANGVGTSQRQWCVSGTEFETAAASLVRGVLMPAGFEPLKIVRAPYFCAGDRNSPVAALDACVIALRRRPGFQPALLCDDCTSGGT